MGALGCAFVKSGFGSFIASQEPELLEPASPQDTRREIGRGEGSTESGRHAAHRRA